MEEYIRIGNELTSLIKDWEPRLMALSEKAILYNRNSQQRNIRQILGHMVDSASNNTHRVVHLQYQKSPLSFPDYAHFGNNDRWIAIQNYQEENWHDLVQLWKYIHFHFVHLIRNLNLDKLENEWVDATHTSISLKTMVMDFPRHFKLHLSEIEELMSV